MKVIIPMFKTLAGLFVGTAMAFAPVATTHAAASATAFVSPAGGTYTTGSTFSVAIYEDSGDNDADSARADLTYDAGKLQATGISAGDFTTCVTAPSANGGSISTGDCTILGAKKRGQQRLATVTFKAIAEGTAAINFSSAKVVNGGTDLPVTLVNGSFTVAAPAQGGMGGGSTSTTTTTSGQNTTVAQNTGTTADTSVATTPTATDDKAKADVKGDTTKANNDNKTKEMVQSTASKKRNAWPWIILTVVAIVAIAYALRNRVNGIKKDVDAEVVKPEQAAEAAAPVAAASAVSNKKKNTHKKSGKKSR
jgi:hypothetical protein